MNALRLEKNSSGSVRVSRPIRLGSKTTVTPVLDVFNLFNRTNVAEVNPVFGTGAYPAEPRRDAQGRITFERFQKTLAPRQVQIAARVSF